VRRRQRALGAVVVALVLFAGMAGASGGVTGGTGGFPSPRADDTAPVIPAGASVARAQAWLTKALSLRLEALSAESIAAGVARNLSAAHRTALNTIIATDRSGLTRLSTGLASETTIAELQATADAMVLDYRVFSLLVPQVSGVILADRELADAVSLAALEPSMQTAITTEERTGNRAAVARRIYARLVALLGAAEASTGATATALLALTPENGTPASTTLATSSSALAAAGLQVVSAEVDVRRIVKILGGT